MFLNGSSTATITLYIQPDPTPKLDATFPVVLQAITQNGLPPGGDPSRGAQLLPGLTVASVTIPAHNDPYGVFVWSPSAVNASQSDVAQTVAVVSIARQAGTVGTVLIQYRYAVVCMHTFLPQKFLSLSITSPFQPRSSISPQSSLTIPSYPPFFLHHPFLHHPLLPSLPSPSLYFCAPCPLPP